MSGRVLLLVEIALDLWCVLMFDLNFLNLDERDGHIMGSAFFFDLQVNFGHGDPADALSSVGATTGTNVQDHVLVSLCADNGKESWYLRFKEPAVECELSPGKGPGRG